MACPECAYTSGEPCRFPDRAIPSLEAYGIDLFTFCTNHGVRYGCDDGKVTYFGIVL